MQVFRYLRRLLSPAGAVVFAAALGLGFSLAAAEQATHERAAQQPGEAVPAHVKLLAEFEIAPTTESIGEYLASLRPSPRERELLESMVAKLGDEDYVQRETATKQLLRRPTGVIPLLEEATKRDDPEIRWRARQILDRSQRESRRLLEAVFSAIEKQKLAGLCSELLSAAPLCKDEFLRAALRRALVVTATAEDAPFLKEQLRSADVQSRIAALATYAHVAPAGVREESLRILGEEAPAADEELIQLAAARILASVGERRSLPALIRLLASEETAVRVESIRILRSLTGQQFGFTVYDPADKRAASVAAWKKWLDTEGVSAELKFPLADVAVDLGRLLVCDMAQQKVIEFDLEGKKTWERQVGQAPWACQGLPNGHRLVGSYQERSVVEFDELGTEVWRCGDLPGGPMSVQRLDNGNTLLACSDAMQVIEVAADKTVVWKATIEGRPTFARRLEDGRTLISLQQAQKVVEVDEAGKIAWELKSGCMSFSVDRTPSGTTLVCDLRLGDIKEFDRAGTVVWSLDGFSHPYTVQRLSGGNTLVADQSGVKELDVKGAVVKNFPMANVYRAHRY